jgi:DNA polymerase-1
VSDAFFDESLDDPSAGATPALRAKAAPIVFATPTQALAGVRVVYVAEAPQAKRLVKGMLQSGLLTIDIETAPHKAEAKRTAALSHTIAQITGAAAALKKLKAPAAETLMLLAARKRLMMELKYAKTAGLDPRRSRIRLLQVYDGGDEVLVIDLDYTRHGVLKLIDGVDIVAHNVAFELAYLEREDVAPRSIRCTMQATRLMLGEYNAGLSRAAEAFLDLRLDKTLQTSDWNAPKLTREQIEYAGVDAVVTHRIAEKILPALGVQRAAYIIQMDATPAVVRMEARGFKLDLSTHRWLIEELKYEREQAQQRYREACAADGHASLAHTVPTTPKLKGELLTALLTSDELAQWRRTEKSGALSTKRSELKRAAHYPPIMALSKLSRLDKLLSSFGENLSVLISPVTHRVHAHYKVSSTVAGRASCAAPNLQQIPRGRSFRSLFIPEPGNLIVVADYASMELRAAAHISGDKGMRRAFEQGLDLHRITAARMTGKAPADVTDEERAGGKAVNFGGIYGQGAQGLVYSAWEQFDLALELTEAQALVRAFEDAYPEFVQWRRDHYAECDFRGTVLIGKDAAKGIGRIYPKERVPLGQSYFTRCCNLPVQGACADASMLALTYADERLFAAGIEGGPVAWLHDEIVLEVRKDQAERAARILSQAMLDGFAETFPGAPLFGLVEPKIGGNWAEAKG